MNALPLPLTSLASLLFLHFIRSLNLGLSSYCFLGPVSKIERLLRVTFHHIALPPKLPGSQDHELGNIKDLTERMRRATDIMLSNSDDITTDTWLAVKESVQLSQYTHHSGSMDLWARCCLSGVFSAFDLGSLLSHAPQTGM